MNIIDHAPEDRLEMYSLGRLSESDAAAVEEHLMICDICRERAEGHHDYSVAMRQALRDVAVADAPFAKSWFGWLRMPAFAIGIALATVLLAVAIFRAQSGSWLPPMATVQLSAARGNLPEIERAQAIDITLLGTASDAGPLKVELVSESGKVLWKEDAPAGSSKIHAVVHQPLSTGDYFMRLHDTSGRFLQEYGFRVR